MTLDMSYPTPLPSTRGWGLGWPNCQAGKIVPHPIFQGGLRAEIVELVDLIVAQAQERDYRFIGGWSWGYACRATKGGSGGTPSFHSWGLALDVNAPENPFASNGMQRSDIALNNRWLVVLFASYGFLWLGPSIGDTMHFHFTGTPADAREMTERAAENLTTEEDDDVNLDKYQQGWDAFEDRLKSKGVDPGTPPTDWATWKKKGWNAARFAGNFPKGTK